MIPVKDVQFRPFALFFFFFLFIFFRKADFSAKCAREVEGEEVMGAGRRGRREVR